MPRPDPRAPIGVFDSGLGGLTVAAALRRMLPKERLLYLGDTARVPYGTRSARTVERYARRAGAFLAARGIKALVVACNTVSAVALEALREQTGLPVLGVIEPGAEAALAASTTGHIGLLATAGTVASGAYERAVEALRPEARIHAEAAPLLVALAEEGWTRGEVPRAVATRYLAPLLARGIDTVLLGCTHFPLLRESVREAILAAAGEPLPIVDGAEATARTLRRTLHERDLLQRESGGVEPLRILVTDRPLRFTEVASRFLGEPPDRLSVQWVDL